MTNNNSEMLVVGMQFEKAISAGIDGQAKVVFSMDHKTQKKAFSALSTLDRGQQLMMVIFDVEKYNLEIREMSTETPEQTKTRFRKKMYAEMSKIAKRLGKTDAEIKSSLKHMLAERGLISSSSSELDTDGLVIAIQLLQTKF